MTSRHASELAGVVAEILTERGDSMAVAESCTAGAIASALASGGSAEQWLRAGLVAYQESVKRSMLGVRSPSLVVAAAAEEMAAGAARLFETRVALATTGVFGDEPVDGIPPTTVTISTLLGADVRTTRHRLADDPEKATEEATELALEQLVDHLEHRPLRHPPSHAAAHEG